MSPIDAKHLPALLLAACATGPSAEQQAAIAEEARKTAGDLVKQLGGELKKSLEANGPEASIPSVAVSDSEDTSQPVHSQRPRMSSRATALARPYSTGWLVW